MAPAAPLTFGKLLWRGSIVAIIGAFGVGFAGVGYRLVKSDVRASVYKERLAELSTEYSRVRDLYAQAIRRTAVTELLVENGKVAVRVRRADGSTETIPTPFSASGEVYVDVAVIDGRLMIRRIFDAHTPPSAAVVVDEALTEVDWTGIDPTGTTMTLGKAVYRTLSEGRWVVSVSGDGSLGLRRAGDADSRDAEDALAPFVDLREFPPVEDAVIAAERSITFGDLWKALVGPVDN